MNARRQVIIRLTCALALLWGYRAAFAEEPRGSLLSKLAPPAAADSAAVRAGDLDILQIRSAAGKPLEFCFELGPDKSAEPYEPLTYSSQTWYGSAFWTGPDWTRVGDRWHHPGNDTPSVRRFEAPRDGQVTVTGRVFKLHLDGDGIRAAILHNDRQVWTAEIDGKDARGVEPRLSLSVRAGDRLRFVVHRRGAIACDTTGWDPVVTYEGGEAFRASDSFGDRQGAGHWFYEMLTSEQPPQAAPVVHAVDKDFALYALPIGSRPLLLSADRWLPFLVLTDGSTPSCVSLAVASPAGWSLAASFEADQILRIRVAASEKADRALAPQCLLASLAGPWTAGLEMLPALRAANPALASATWQPIDEAWNRATEGLPRKPEPDLLLAVQDDWQLSDGIDGSGDSYRKAALDHLERAAALLSDPSATAAPPRDWTERLVSLKNLAGSPSSDPSAWSRLYFSIRLLKREVLLGDRSLRFGPMLFCKRKPPSWSHLVAQYFGWRQRPGGGLFVLDQPGYSLRHRNLLGDSLPEGNILQPNVSFDADRIVFSFVACRDGQTHDPADFCVNEAGPDERYFHIYQVRSDGSNLRQLTGGPYDDLMPAWLADGDIVFCSTRRRGYSRCFGPEYSARWDAYTLHRMKPDGAEIRPISSNDVNEWFPSVANTGHLLFARWDYIDRDAVTHQNLWAMRPDGTSPFALWGNELPKPHCAFQARAIPGSRRIVFVASAHHSITAGPVCILDPSVGRNVESAVARITPGPLPEAESSKIPEYYESPWPLSENRFLVAYSRDRLRFQGEHIRDPNPDNALGIYLIDRSGNRELVFRDPHVSSTSPMPLAARSRPPIVPSSLAEGDPAPTGEMLLANVYQGLGDAAPGTVKQLRIVQLFPKATQLANLPPIGFAGEENARAILGTAPVEADGSARFLVPAGLPVYFQALDEEGFAYQTMRSSTHVRAGERVACVGCHEPAMTAPPAAAALPIAFSREPSRIEPGQLGGRPFSYVEVVQPVLDRHCADCHNAERADGGIDLSGAPHEGYTRSYWALGQGPMDWRKTAGTETASDVLVPRFGQRNQLQTTLPGGKFGARGSRLIELLRKGHEDVRLNRDELARLAAWIDLNAIFYGVYLPEEQQRQLRGQLVGMPALQ